MVRIEETTQLLMRLIAGDDPEIVRQESQELLAVIEPQDIALAEQKLLELGIGVENFRGLCVAHMEAFKDYKPQNLSALPTEHVLNTMLSEHEMILCFVSELEDIDKEVQLLDYCAADSAQIKKLTLVAKHLVLADERHQRQDEIILPELERRGYYGPSQIIKMGHISVNHSKYELKDLVEQGRAGKTALWLVGERQGAVGHLDRVGEGVGGQRTARGSVRRGDRGRSAALIG